MSDRTVAAAAERQPEQAGSGQSEGPGRRYRPEEPGRENQPREVPPPRRALRGVIIDWGGVLTNPILETVTAWLEADGIDQSAYAAVMRPWMSQAYSAAGAEVPIHALERGECEEEDFERLLAARLVRLDGGPVDPAGLLTRMFAATILDEAMLDLLRAVRRAQLRTALLSNSWCSSTYPRDLFPELFDAVVISCEVGMRKPEERIFRRAAQLLGLAPAECVFIDDIEANVAAAQAAGLVGVLHSDPAATAEQLSELLGISLGRPS